MIANHLLSKNNDNAPAIWVVFSGQTDRPWLGFLRKGFRHCFVVINDGQRWISFDPMLNHIELKIHDHVPADFDLPRWLQKRGHIAVKARQDLSHKTPAPLALFTCVEAVKRFLGVHRFGIQTPWQLYRYLN
jgi:hypothetical protein